MMILNPRTYKQYNINHVNHDAIINHVNHDAIINHVNHDAIINHVNHDPIILFIYAFRYKYHKLPQRRDKWLV